MRGHKFTTEVEMVVEQCCNCGMLFAMTEDFKNAKLRKRGTNEETFYCPAGHPQHYLGETSETKLRRERDRLKQNAAYQDDRIKSLSEQRDHAEARARGYKGYAAKLTKRAKAGVCPCCNRHFDNMERHMADKHPDFEGVKADG